MSILTIDAELDLAGFRLRVDEEITSPGITAIFGRSGSGKTTLLRIIAGLERRCRADLKFGETVWQNSQLHLAPYRRRIGYVFQDARLFPHMDVEQNLKFPMKHSATALGFDDIVAAFELRDFMQRRPESLSGGETQRVAIARALLGGPQLLLMDEPLSSLDIQRKKDILPLIEALPREFGVPVIYVTHDTNELVRLADQVLVLAGGKVAARGDVQQIFDRADIWPILGMRDASSVLNTEVQGFADGMTTLSIGRQTLRVPGQINSLGAHSRIRIHARDVVIATQRVEHLSIRNTLECTLLQIDSDDRFNADLTLDVDSQHLRARITRSALDDLDLREGRRVYALIKSVAADPNA